MCLAIYKPSGVLIDEDRLDEGMVSNPHSAGFAAVVNGRMLIRRGFTKFEDFIREYREFQTHQAVIHFRWATHGDRSHKNSHPFRVTDELAMIHNGVLDIETKSKPARSDTWHYVQSVLAPMAKRDRDFFLHPDMVYLGSQAISGSKFVFLRADGSHGIWNEDDGHWDSDCWYSNYSYRRIGYTSRYWSGSFWRKDDKVRVPDKKEDDSPIIVGQRTPGQEAFDQWMDEMRDKAQSESQYLHQLPVDVLYQYEDLLEHGYSVEELDREIRDNGIEGIESLYNYHCGEAE